MFQIADIQKRAEFHRAAAARYQEKFEIQSRFNNKRRAQLAGQMCRYHVRELDALLLKITAAPAVQMQLIP